MVVERDRSPTHQRVGRPLAADLDLEKAIPEVDPEGQLVDMRREPRLELEGVGVMPHSAEAVDGGEPGSGERGHVHPVAYVVLEVFEVHQSGLGQVVVGQLEVAYLGGDYRLGA